MSNNKRHFIIELIIHILIWLFLLILTYSFTVGNGRSWNELFNHFWLQIFFLAIIFYLNYLFMVDKWLFSDQKWLFFAGNIALVLFFVWLRHEIMVNYTDGERPPAEDHNRIPPPFAFRFYIDGLTYLIPIAFAMALRSGKRSIKLEAVKKESEHIKIQSELQHLKYQLQPHFFFNALNNIYALIDHDPEKAKQSIHSLSKLMRHLLQNSDHEKIPLSDEIDFLKKYINLMSLRQNSSVTITSEFPENIPALMIAPLLFVSIVENAFKHGISATRPSLLEFKMLADENRVVFISKNKNLPKHENDMSGSGIGIENLKKRLILLYPKHHTLDIVKTDEEFEVFLTINISR